MVGVWSVRHMDVGVNEHILSTIVFYKADAE